MNITMLKIPAIIMLIVLFVIFCHFSPYRLNLRLGGLPGKDRKNEADDRCADTGRSYNVAQIQKATACNSDCAYRGKKADQKQENAESFKNQVLFHEDYLHSSGYYPLYSYMSCNHLSRPILSP